MFSQLTRLMIAAAFMSGCGEETPAPNKPFVTAASAVCRAVGTDSVVKLASVTVSVTDLDGAEDLDSVRAIVGAVGLEMEKVPLTDATPVDGCDGEEDVCQAEYRWRRGANTPQILCGDSGNQLQIQFEVKDVAGFADRVIISTSLEQN